MEFRIYRGQSRNRRIMIMEVGGRFYGFCIFDGESLAERAKSAIRNYRRGVSFTPYQVVPERKLYMVVRMK